MDELRRPESAQKIALETRLLAQVAAGGSARDVAMRALFDAYQTKFLKGLKWSGLPLEIAQEVMQEVWIAVMKKAADFRPGTAPSSWLWGFVENARHDALRKWLRPARHERDRRRG
jgi:DNA-directed RNA polymerase specialized sigma24 family protein